MRAIVLALYSIVFLSVGTPVFAADSSAAPTGGNTRLGIISGGEGKCDWGTGKLELECVNIVIGNAIKIAFGFAGTICLLMIIIAGYQIALGGITGSGDTGGKERLKWALLGFFMTACTFGIINAALSAIS